MSNESQKTSLTSQALLCMYTTCCRFFKGMALVMKCFLNFFNCHLVINLLCIIYKMECLNFESGNVVATGGDAFSRRLAYTVHSIAVIIAALFSS